MLRYAGIDLPLATPPVIAWCERFIDPRDTMEFASRPWPGATTLLMSWPQYLIPRRVKPGTLYWPTGAARWAVGYFCCGEKQLEKIREKCYGKTGDHKLEPQLLEMETQHGKVNPEMYMLPPRPCSGEVKGNNLYLLTLVDARYFLQFQDIGEAAAGTWEDLLGMVEDTDLFTDNPIDREPIEDVYLGPSRTITTTHSEPLGSLLDAIAWNTGRRLVRHWDEDSWELLKPAQAKQLLGENHGLPHTVRAAGRSFRFGTLQAGNEVPPGKERERGAVLPQGVRLLFPPSFEEPYPLMLTPGWTPKDITALSCGYPQISATVPALRRVFHDDLATDAATDDELQNLAQQLAQDYYDWRYEANFDICFDGVLPWLSDGLTDCIEWTYAQGQSGLITTTRVQRGVWNGDPDKFNHAPIGAGSGSDSGSSGSGCPTSDTIEFEDACTGCIRTVRAFDAFGRTITFEVCEDCPGSGAGSGG